MSQIFNPSILLLLLIAGKPVIKSGSLHIAGLSPDLLEELSPFFSTNICRILSMKNAVEQYNSSNQHYFSKRQEDKNLGKLLSTLKSNNRLPALNHIDSIISNSSKLKSEAQKIKSGNLSALLPNLMPPKLNSIMSQIEKYKGMASMLNLLNFNESDDNNANTVATESDNINKDATKLIDSLDNDVKVKIQSMQNKLYKSESK